MSILSHIGTAVIGFGLAIYLIKIGSPKIMLVIQSDWTEEYLRRRKDEKTREKAGNKEKKD